jgi:hypothetical protein
MNFFDTPIAFQVLTLFSIIGMYCTYIFIYDFVAGIVFKRDL